MKMSLTTLFAKIAYGLHLLLAMAPPDWAPAETSQDWPQFHRPNRDSICSETGMLQEWPEEQAPGALPLDTIGRIGGPGLWERERQGQDDDSHGRDACRSQPNERGDLRELGGSGVEA